MAIDLTKVYGRLNDIKKNIFYKRDSDGTPAKLQLFSVNTLLAELKTGWYISVSTSSDFVLESEAYELSISNVYSDLDIANILLQTTAVQFKGVKYKVTGLNRPLHATENWILEIVPYNKDTWQT